MERQVTSKLLSVHPCQSCGACCSSFRVTFHWLNSSLKTDDGVPIEFIENIQDEFPSMKGTLDKHRPKCEALDGRVGNYVSCKIYENRPSPCRLFKASYEDGYIQPRCDEARLKHGLKPLSAKDWDKAYFLNHNESFIK